MILFFIFFLTATNIGILSSEHPKTSENKIIDFPLCSMVYSDESDNRDTSLISQIPVCQISVIISDVFSLCRSLYFIPILPDLHLPHFSEAFPTFMLRFKLE